MYEADFESDWTELSQEAVMFRAFALGVDAALGNDNPEEFRRLAGEFQRALIQIAFDEGESRAAEAAEKRGIDPEKEDPFDLESREYEWDIWDELVTK